MDFDDLTRADLLWAAAALFVALAGFSIWAERRRVKRADLDRPGLVPWHAVQIFALFLAVAAAALATKGG